MKHQTEVVQFAVEPDHIKAFPDPNGLGRKRWFVQIAVDELSKSAIEYGPNPRCQNLETKVAGAIRETLKAEPGWFMYYNKGIVLNAKQVNYDNKARTLTLHLDRDMSDPWESPNGNLDGGHTNRVILDLIQKGWQNATDPSQRQFVTVEILTGIDEDKLAGLVGARNTNIPVRDLSLAVLGNELDWLLDIFAKAGLKNEIAWRQFDKDAEVPGEEVLAYLSLLNPEVKEKIRCYSSAGRLVTDLKLRPEHKVRNATMEGLKQTGPIAVEFLKFVDFVHKSMETWYLKYKDAEGTRAKFGNLAGISTAEENRLIFLRDKIRYRAAKAWLMPLSYAFVSVVEEERRSPAVWHEVAEAVGPDLMRTVVEMTKDENYNLTVVGKKKAFWDTLRALIEARYWRNEARKRR
jgi:hypothetical protein